MHGYRNTSLLLLLLAAMLLPLRAEADNDTNRFEHYRKQYTKLHENYLRSPDDVANIAALAYFYSEPDNPMRNLPLAMDYIQISENRYKVLISDQKRYREVNRLIRKGFSIVELRQRRHLILDEARKYIKNGIQPDEADAFLRAFADDKVICKEINRQKSVHAYNKAIELNTEKAYKEYLDNSANTYERQTIIENLKKLLKQRIGVAATEQAVDEIVEGYQYPEIKQLAELRKSEINYIQATEENTAEAYTRFLRRYPTSDKYDKVLSALDTLAYNEFRVMTSPRQYADFALKYSDLPPSEQAVDSLVSMAVNQQNNDALRIFLNEFKSDEHYNEVYKSYYQRFGSEGDTAPILMFQRQNPNFPLQFLIDDDLKIAKEVDQIKFMEPFTEAMSLKNGDWLKMYMGKGINYVILQRLLQPYTTAGNWKGAVEYMNKYDICFENRQRPYYLQLKQLLNEGGKGKSAVVYAPRYNLSHPQITSSGVMYANKVMNHTTQVLELRQHKNGTTEREVVFDTIDADNITLFSVSNDGKTMLIGRKGDIFVARLTDTVWKISDLEAENLNTVLNYEGDASFTPDGMGLLFVSDRPDGYNVNKSGMLFHGDTALASDIYYMPRTAEGWGQPINLGSVVNTAFSERSPVLSKDLTTLYFASDRNGGLGFYDIYMTTRTNTNSWTEWSTPVNIGKMANTSFSEPTLSISPDEEYLYFTSNSPNLQRYSIHRCTTRHNRSAFYRTATINCHRVNNLQNMNIKVVDIPSGVEVHQYRKSDSINVFKFDIFAKKDYLVSCSMKGYYIPVMYLNSEENSVAPQAYELRSCVTNRTRIPLATIRFEEGTDKLTPLSEAEIKQVAKQLKDKSRLKVEIISNVTGDNAKEAYELSLRRSKALKDALIDQNIDAQRIVASGYGNLNYKKNSAVKAVEVIFFEDK